MNFGGTQTSRPQEDLIKSIGSLSLGICGFRLYQLLKIAIDPTWKNLRKFDRNMEGSPGDKTYSYEI